MNVIRYFEKLPEVEALLLAGSIAHGLATPTSDVDVLILLTEDAHAKRVQVGQLTFFTHELCTYPEGYVDGKFIRFAFLKQVADSGSEPARFAFADAKVLFSRIDDLEAMLRAAARYPVEGKTERMRQFHAQLEAWNWYANEALKHGNRYLLWHSVSKLVLFGGRLILAHNEALYPFHKWFLAMLERVEDQPGGLFAHISHLYDNPSRDTVQAFYETVKGFQEWPDLPAGWGNQFMLDSELNWVDGRTPVDDL